MKSAPLLHERQGLGVSGVGIRGREEDDEVADLPAALRARVRDRVGDADANEGATTRRDFHPRLWAIRVAAVVSTPVASTSGAKH